MGRKAKEPADQRRNVKLEPEVFDRLANRCPKLKTFSEYIGELLDQTEAKA